MFFFRARFKDKEGNAATAVYCTAETQEKAETAMKSLGEANGVIFCHLESLTREYALKMVEECLTVEECLLSRKEIGS